MNIKDRLHNYGLWVAIFAFIPMILQTFGVKVIPENYQELVNSLLGILVLLGLLNNPTTETKGFGDDKTE